MTEYIDRSILGWQEVKKYKKIKYHRSDSITRIAFDTPNKRNAFKPLTKDETIEAFKDTWYNKERGPDLFIGNSLGDHK